MKNFYKIFGSFKFSFVPPLMIYLAAGISGITNIVGLFFVKEYLDLSAVFLAGLGFWAGLPWVLKMPLGHLVDILWKFKSIKLYKLFSFQFAFEMPIIGIEPMTYRLRDGCSTAELYRQI